MSYATRMEYAQALAKAAAKYGENSPEFNAINKSWSTTMVVANAGSKSIDVSTAAAQGGNTAYSGGFEADKRERAANRKFLETKVEDSQERGKAAARAEYFYGINASNTLLE